jgi:Arc/MetJ-type ribon-helix-helix transcriptional regulator
VRKISIYLGDSDLERLRRLVVAESRSQAEIIRAALSAYERARTAPRAFALEGAWAGDGSSVADEAHRQSRVLADSKAVGEDQAFVDAISEWPPE